MREAEHLLDLGRDRAGPPPRPRAISTMNSWMRRRAPMSTPRDGSSRISELRSPNDPLGQEHLLLVAARIARDAAVDGVGVTPSCDQRLRPRTLLAPAHDRRRVRSRRDAAGSRWGGPPGSGPGPACGDPRASWRSPLRHRSSGGDASIAFAVDRDSPARERIGAEDRARDLASVRCRRGRPGRRSRPARTIEGDVAETGARWHVAQLRATAGPAIRSGGDSAGKATSELGRASPRPGVALVSALASARCAPRARRASP